MKPLAVEDYRDEYNRYFKEFHRLAPPELSYGNDQPNDTASSLESCIAYANYILSKENRLPDILNAGAGASSWIFKKIFGMSTVTCADPHLPYLNLIGHICAREGLGMAFLHGLNWGQHGKTFNHIYYDYGDIERIPYFGAALDLAMDSMYVDDMQDETYRDIVIKLCSKKGLKWFYPKSESPDGRYGIIIEK